MATSDAHSIIDSQTQSRINPAADIVVHNHVWIGNGTYINKGCEIGENTIIGGKYGRFTQNHYKPIKRRRFFMSTKVENINEIISQARSVSKEKNWFYIAGNGGISGKFTLHRKSTL